jgi:predicted amidophosphoribosyltransferase
MIALFDDVLTTGCHFRAAKSILEKSFHEVEIIGLFIARRAPETMEIEDLSL